MKFSVVVPAYNCKGRLEAALRSIRSGSFSDYELIVVDDCSSDGTAIFAAEQADTVIALTEHRGPAFARNRGAEKAVGEYIVWTDSDVVWPADLLSRTAALIDANPGCTGVSAWSGGEPLNGGFAAEFTMLQENFFLDEYLKSRNGRRFGFVTTRCGAVKRDLFFAAGMFDERYLTPGIEDYEFSLRFRRFGDFIYLPDSGVRHRWPASTLNIASRLFRNSYLWSNTIKDAARFEDAVTTRGRALANVAGALFFLSLPACALGPWFAAAPLFFALAGFYLNRKIFMYFMSRKGLFFALGGAALLMALAPVVSAGAAYGIIMRGRGCKLYEFKTQSGS